MVLILLLDCPRAMGLWEYEAGPLAYFSFERFGFDVCGWMEEGGVDEPFKEFNVEDDFAVGTVPLEMPERLEPLGDFSVLTLVFFRIRSLKNGILRIANFDVSKLELQLCSIRYSWTCLIIITGDLDTREMLRRGQDTWNE